MIVQYVADRKPAANLAPKPGTLAQRRQPLEEPANDGEPVQALIRLGAQKTALRANSSA